ncbi:hypothetical protein BU25DRAFT_14674 [Macroventuria anomochaeta]|uniref:Uncharacterized protein n=1 Tax=Macroventuria anomochaeta TaxID=301207 RepID=A0ACB6SI39_9PLEO|nr:uncharacterized protein BU25DRAFT_14674 [Macroventuria anomochaeta]KAF2633901.1 hypothetical protein BU25DRAFT_14674 [Macroventuria anomochaeta]
MADAQFESQQRQFTTPSMDSRGSSAKRRKVIGQCPTCHQSFASRHELRAHMADPQIHAPASDSDAVSFGELSSDYDSLDEDSSPHKPSATKHEDEPTLNNDGFAFSSSDGIPSMEQDGFEFTDADPSFFPSAAHMNAEQGSVHTMHDEDEQPSAEHKAFDNPIQTPPRRATQPKGGALGVLYCGTCDKYFGNEKVFKRHFMFGVKHGEEPRDMMELYYRVWGSSWADEAKETERNGRVAEVDEMEL